MIQLLIPACQSFSIPALYDRLFPMIKTQEQQLIGPFCIKKAGHFRAPL